MRRIEMTEKILYQKNISIVPFRIHYMCTPFILLYVFNFFSFRFISFYSNRKRAALNPKIKSIKVLYYLLTDLHIFSAISMSCPEITYVRVLKKET